MKVYAKQALAVAIFGLVAQAAFAQNDDVISQEDDLDVLDTTVVKTAEEELKQAQGVSIVTEEDLKRRPVTNDISEIVRTMPGINLTGNTNSGQYGNKRQIDVRGMGPENTLILIDGKPVLSRNSVKMGRSGERDTRGDSNWVPAEAIESIEVIRGPAAARYGSGASGGVINIITKKPESASATISVQTEIPENSDEGSNKRANLVLSGPLTERFSQRTILNYNKLEGDDPDLNRDYTPEDESVGAGREGVVNEDFRTLLRYDMDERNTLEAEFSYSRQGNIYSGSNLRQGVDHELTNSYIGEETSVMRRSTASLTHRGNYDFGDSFSYVQWEQTKNTRLSEGLAGGGEGVINTEDSEMNTIELLNVTAKSEWNIPLQWFSKDQTLTAGAEYRGEWQDDESSNQSSINLADGIELPDTTLDPDARDSEMDASLVALYFEDNILLTESVTLTPGVRFDQHSEAGFNVSPSLNTSWQATDELTFQLGLSRAFKAPNLYQLNPNYVYTTRGNGCPVNYPSLGSGCSVIGNEDLEHETSFNKEVGFNYKTDLGFNAGLTYFHNDYHNKIFAGNENVLYAYDGGSGGLVQIFQWENADKAVVEGLEGNLLIPFGDNVEWSTNATVMLESENKDTGEPLSLVPDYTINSMLSWQVNDIWELNLSGQHYGETESATTSVATGDVIEDPEPRKPYTIMNFSTVLSFNNGIDLDFSVKNLLDKGVFREGTQTSSAGANTYNEPGRSFLISASYTF